MQSLKVLVADDDPTNLEILNVILTGAGHRVLLVTSGPEAVARAPDFQPDLVFMDAVMPGAYGGLEAIRRLKAMPDFRGVIVCQSARASGVDQLEGKAAGADAYLTKPFRRRDVLDLMQELSARIRPARRP